MKKITKSDVITFLGILVTTLVTTLLNRRQQKGDIQDTVQAVLAEERRQIAMQEVHK